MTTLRAHFDGKHVVLDEPAPPELAPNTPVTVVVGKTADDETALDKIAKLARPLGLPPDFSEQHEHSIKGTPKR